VAIHFFSEDISFTLSDEQRTRHWINKVLNNEHFKAENINYIFCSDSHLLKINQQYLGHDSFTDIITFDNSEQKENLEADIFISVERVEENAARLKKNFDEELHRVLIHGLLHLIGYQDKTDADKIEMREKEDACLSLR
jgi:probable rRNA maturation factor